MKNKKNNVKQLCKKYTSLEDSEIVLIENLSNSIQDIAKKKNCDVFIDVLTRNEDIAIVVAEGILSKAQSVYKSTVLGEKALRNNEPAVLRSLETGMISKDIKALTQENRYVKQTVYPIKTKGKNIAVLIFEKDISFKFKEDFYLEDEKKENSSQLMNLVNSTNIINNSLDAAILIFDKNGKLVIKNTKATKLYKDIGYMDEILGMDHDNLALDHVKFIDLKTKYPQGQDIRLETEVKIGKYFFKIKTIYVTEENLRVIKIIDDITDIKLKEAEIISKSVAIREIHHRVKNNLQTVASLLRIQSRRCKTEEAKIALKESVNRILAIASTHELLSKQIDDEISILDVINSMVANAKMYFGSSTSSIRIEVKGEDFDIDSDRITTISLIINELIQNCYDHAFIGRENGTIVVKVSGDGEKISIAVSDNGCGYNEAKEKSGSLGLSIVRTYVEEKLNGTLEVKDNPSNIGGITYRGTTVQFTFEL